MQKGYLIKNSVGPDFETKKFSWDQTILAVRKQQAMTKIKLQ